MLEEANVSANKPKDLLEKKILQLESTILYYLRIYDNTNIQQIIITFTLKKQVIQVSLLPNCY